MSASKRFKIDIPEGFRIYYKEFQVAGVSYRRKELSSLLDGKEIEFRLVAEPSNEHDKNAIKVIGSRKSMFGKMKHYHLGYVPAEIASDIAQRQCAEVMMVRPKNIWVGDSGGIKFVIDLLGLKSSHEGYFGT